VPVSKKVKKKSKTPKAPNGRGGNGSGKDTVTGLFFEMIIPENSSKPTRIESDKQYGLESELIQEFLSVGYQVKKTFTTFNTEYEFNNDYIIQTIEAVDSVPDSTGDFDWITRMVYQGDFRYIKGVLTSASINLIAQAWDSSHLGGSLWRFPQPIKIKNPSSLASWASSLNLERWPDAWNTDSYSSMNIWNEAYTSTMRMENGKEIWEYGAGKAAIYALGDGRIFYDGWETNPFATNLI